MRPPETNAGHPGVIIFDEEPAAAPHNPPLAALPPPGVADLKRQVQDACGRQARDVVVEMQGDGGTLVKVKVTSPAAEKQVLGKVLSIPMMASPNIRLATEISP